MDMVNDGKDTRLDTPQAVKEASTSRAAAPWSPWTAMITKS